MIRNATANIFKASEKIVFAEDEENEENVRHGLLYNKTGER